MFKSYANMRQPADGDGNIDHCTGDAGLAIALINRDGEKMCTISKGTNPCCYTMKLLFKVKKMVSVPKVQSVQMQTVKNDCRSCRGSLYSIGPLPA